VAGAAAAGEVSYVTEGTEFPLKRLLGSVEIGTSKSHELPNEEELCGRYPVLTKPRAVSKSTQM
jgi:hypothetical protein